MTFVFQVVLLAEDADIDVDESSVALRWTILACGDGFVLANSPTLYGSSCGLPSEAVNIFIDKQRYPTGTVTTLKAWY